MELLPDTEKTSWGSGHLLCNWKCDRSCDKHNPIFHWLIRGSGVCHLIGNVTNHVISIIRFFIGRLKLIKYIIHSLIG